MLLSSRGPPWVKMRNAFIINYTEFTDMSQYSLKIPKLSSQIYRNGLEDYNNIYPHFVTIRCSVHC